MTIKMNEHEKKILGEFNLYKEGKTVNNRYSGVEVYLCAEALSLYDSLLGCESLLYKLSEGILPETLVSFEKTEEIFLTAREVFRKNWPKEFMLLVD